MQSLAKELLIASIVNSLPCGHHLVSSLSKDQSLLVIRWMPAGGDTVISDVILYDDLTESIQRAIDLKDENLLRQYLGKLEGYVCTRVKSFDCRDKRPWFLTADIFGENRYSAPF